MYLSLSPNTQLCGSCIEKLSQNEALAKQLMGFYGFGNLADGAGSNDFVGVFGEEELTCTDKQINGYCKFTSAEGNMMVAWS